MTENLTGINPPQSTVWCLCRQTASDAAAFSGLRNRDWGDAQRASFDPLWLSLEGLNLELAEEPGDGMMTTQPATSRQQLLEEVLQTKELLQNKQRHKNSGVCDSDANSVHIWCDCFDRVNGLR